MAQVVAEVHRAAAAVRAPAPLRDGRLDLVATDIARATVAKRLPSFDAIAFLVHHYGIVEPEPYIVMMRSSPGVMDPFCLTYASKRPASSRWATGAAWSGGQAWR